MSELPPCGLYRTLAQIADVEAGRLVYFHNHGDPGPGLYLPERWSANRAHFSARGHTVPAGFDGKALRPLPAEGFYRVKKDFFCCAKKCRTFETDALVQLGYNGAGKPLVFIPELGGGAITVPERGSMIDDAALVNLTALKVVERRDEIAMPRGIVIH